MGNEPTVYEGMAAAISHELRDFEKWFIGLATGERTILMLSRMPIVGRALAQHTHAPNSVRLVAGWILNPVVRESPSAKQSEFGIVLQDWGCEGQANMLPLLSPYVYGRGDVDVGFGSAAQVDKYGNCNIVCGGVSTGRRSGWWVQSFNLATSIFLAGRLLSRIMKKGNSWTGCTSYRGQVTSTGQRRASDSAFPGVDQA